MLLDGRPGAEAQAVRANPDLHHVDEHKCEADRHDHLLHVGHAAFAKLLPQQDILDPARRCAGEHGDDDGGPQWRASTDRDKRACRTERDLLAVREVAESRGAVDERETD